MREREKKKSLNKYSSHEEITIDKSDKKKNSDCKRRNHEMVVETITKKIFLIITKHYPSVELKNFNSWLVVSTFLNANTFWSNILIALVTFL